MLDFIKGHDMFGHKVELTFNKDGSEHKTVVGGFISIFIKAFLLWYTCTLFIKMWFHQDDKITTTNYTQDFDEMGYVEMSEINTVNFYTLVDSRNFEPIEYDDHAKRHIRLKAYNVAWEINGGKKRSIRQELRVEKCKISKFNDQSSKEYLATLQLQKLEPICIADRERVYLEGQNISPRAKLVYFFIEKCRGDGCAGEQDINNFINSLGLYHMSVQD